MKVVVFSLNTCMITLRKPIETVKANIFNVVIFFNRLCRYRFFLTKNCDMKKRIATKKNFFLQIGT